MSRAARRFQYVDLPWSPLEGQAPGALDTGWKGGLNPILFPTSKAEGGRGWPELPDWTVYVRYRSVEAAISPGPGTRLNDAPAEVRVEWGDTAGPMSVVRPVHALGTVLHVVGKYVRVSARRRAFPIPATGPGELTPNQDVEILVVPGAPQCFCEPVNFPNADPVEFTFVRRPLPEWSSCIAATTGPSFAYQWIRPDGSIILGNATSIDGVGIPECAVELEVELAPTTIFSQAFRGLR